MTQPGVETDPVARTRTSVRFVSTCSRAFPLPAEVIASTARSAWGELYEVRRRLACHAVGLRSLCEAAEVSSLPAERDEVAAATAAVQTGLAAPEALPGWATSLLVEGQDSPALRELAGLDLALYDPYDARDLFAKATDELGYDAVPEDDAVARSACLIARCTLDSRLSCQQCTHLFYRLAVRRYESWPRYDPEVGRLFGLDDEWEVPWRDLADVEADVLLSCRELLIRHGLDDWNPNESLLALLGISA